MSSHDDQSHEIATHDPNRPHSFDLTLELERQLEAESLPNSPAHDRPQSLDSHVLASIVTTLRIGMSELSKERDELAAALEASRQKEQQLGDALVHLSGKQESMNEELETLRTKSKEDDESIVLLRSKVEESRRGLMRLQTESRRMSRGGDMSVDLSRAGSFSFGGGPPSSKRASFAPLTGTPSARMSHRRISSVVSESNAQWAEPAHSINKVDGSPKSQTVTLPDVSTAASYPPTQPRRFSGMFGRSAPPEPEALASGLAAVEVEALHREVKTLKAALEETRHELTESTEAREASDTCVKALRDFIAEHNVGAAPIDTNVAARLEESERKSIGSASGNGSRWGFGGLWRKDEGSTSPVVTRSSAPANAPPPAPMEPLTKKIGGFFSGRTSISSVTSNPPRNAPTVQEAMYNGSDTSSSVESTTEPVSPTSEQLQVLTRVESQMSGSSVTSGVREKGRAAEGIKVVA